MTTGFNPAELMMFVLGVSLGVPIAAIAVVMYWFRR